MADRANLPNPNPCTPGQENRNWQLTNLILKQIIEDIESGVVDTFKFMEASGGTEGFWNEKIQNEGTYDGGVTHQLVSWQIDVDGTVILFTDTSAAGGDNYTVKVEAAGTAGYLESKIHAATWEPTDTYASGTHFIVLAANVSDAVRFYAPYNIIKNSSGDSAPNYLYNKFANGTLTAYNSSLHTPVYVNDTGGTLSLYALDTDIVSAVGSNANLRFVKVENGDVNVGTVTSGNLQPGTCATMKEMVRNGTTGKLEEAGDLTGITYPSIDPVVVASGRWKLGTVLPYAQDPTKLALIKVDCYSST